MQFESFTEFLNMGGYAFYVWLSFGVTFVAMAMIAIQSFIKHRNLMKQVVVEQERKARIKKARLQQQGSM
ncbi:heme exporter protein CcmD [Alteromonas sp. KUL106]|uniref:heme exporter protein CcmD n=1 Tax=Alteromonas sp. KUL106 TaxID=2480799 RepID=UPI0012E6CC29|nr:heme exporter protein CcmD [Alteromonas sp. KUL106]GFD67256.1 heme exporter protein D [Alteromonas sp. KUL106]